MHRSIRSRWLLTMTLALLASPTYGGEKPASPDITEPPPRQQFLVLPLHVHILTAKDRPDIDCKLSDADIDRILTKVNRVWSFGGIAFRVESLDREEAENIEQFDAHKKSIADGGLGVYRLLAPAATKHKPGLHVYYVHELPPNGVYLGQNICFIKETASLRKVEGGIDEPLPRVSSHELGHALGLPHRQNKTNLMASGTTGTILNEAEATRVREMAKKVEGVQTAAECDEQLRKLEQENDKSAAARLRAALAAVPSAK